MILLGFVRAVGELNEDVLQSKLVDEKMQKTCNNVNKNLQKTRITARLLLLALLEEYEKRTKKEIHPKTLPTLSYNENGKPYIEGLGASFSLSHDGDMCFCVLSDEGDVGCDVQSMPKNVMMLRRAAKRFGASWRPAFDCCSFPEYSVLFYTVYGGELQRLPDNAGIALLSVDEDSFIIDERAASDDEELLLSWCELEAELKLSGAGFSGRTRDVKKTDIIKKSSFLMNKGGRFAFSLAVRNKKTTR